METLTNIVNTATSTVSQAIYGAEPAKTTNETAGKEPVSGQTGKGTVSDPYDQGNSESALDKNTASATGTSTGTGIESTREIEPTGSIQKPEDLINAYNKEAGDSTTTTTATTATAATDKTGVTDKLWTATDVDAVKPSVANPSAAPETGATNSTGKDTLWRGVDAYKDTSSTGAASTGITSTEPTTTAVTAVEPTSTGITTIEPSSSSHKDASSTGSTSGPKGAVDAEPKNYSIGDLTSGKETPSKAAGGSTDKSGLTTSHSTPHSTPKTGEAAISPPDLSTTSPGTKPEYSADTHKPSESAGLASNRAGNGGPNSALPSAPANHSSSISPSGGDDDEKSGKLHGLKDKLKNKLHIGSKDH